MLKSSGVFTWAFLLKLAYVQIMRNNFLLKDIWNYCTYLTHFQLKIMQKEIVKKEI